MKEKLEAISKMSKEKIAEIKDSQALNDFKVKVLGKYDTKRFSEKRI